MAGEEPLWRQRRRQDWAALQREVFDLIVIGGGITGAGIAWQAALGGLATLLVEARDWAGGTSSRSSKLVHGGLRYLPHGEVRLVREVGHEREVLERLWPHLVRPLPFLIPVYRRRGMPLWALGAGVWLYDRLTGVEPAHRRRMLGPEGVLALEGGLAAQDLTGGVSYFEARTDDARLVYTVVEAARAAGAVALSRVRARRLDLTPKGGTVELEDAETGDAVTVRVRAAVNASGPWTGEVDPEGTQVALGRGCHLVFPHARLPLRHAVALPAPDGGNTFAVPRGQVTYIGTTDRLYTGDPELPDVPDEDVRYLFTVARASFPAAELSPRDLLAVYAGVRPLVAQAGKADTRELSRQRSIEVRGDGLISVRGGKLTGFRSVAADTLRLLARGGLGPKPERGFEGVDGFDPKRATADLVRDFPAAGAAAAEIVGRHGQSAGEVLRYAASRPGGFDRVAPGVSLLWGEVDYLAEREDVFTLPDLLIRRTAVLWFGGLSEPSELLRPVAERVAPILGWSPQEVSAQVQACRREAHLDRLEELRRLAI